MIILFIIEKLFLGSRDKVRTEAANNTVQYLIMILVEIINYFSSFSYYTGCIKKNATLEFPKKSTLFLSTKDVRPLGI